jgi:heat shock protein HslJ
MKQALMMVAASLMLFCGGCMSDQSSEGNTDTELTDTFWVLKRIGDSDVVRAEGLEDPHMTLTASDEVRGFAGCNRFFGSYQQQATTLIFGPLGSTRMACEQLDQETAFLSKLVGPVTYRIRGNTLEIVDESGTVALSFEAGTNP